MSWQQDEFSSFKYRNPKVPSGDTSLFDVIRSPVLQTAPMINTYIHPQMLGEPG
tara:strand:- start:215 stop:376 length:162 start_codon:yes stop_codon:yes gene_type:complete